MIRCTAKDEAFAMVFDHRTRRATTTGTGTATEALGPGKRTLTEQLPVQRRCAAGAHPPGAAPAPARVLDATGGGRPPLQTLFGVQRSVTAVTAETATTAANPAQVHAAAARGIATPATRLPYADQIQRAFGRHDISRIEAHTGADAAASARAMGAAAYAAGEHVVLGDGVDLRTVAHEAAHVVQQRGGVELEGGVGQVGDAYERQADEVADRVTRGDPVEHLLDHHVANRAGTGSVQRMIEYSKEITDDARDVIECVLASNPVLSAMWQWIMNHKEVTLHVGQCDRHGASAAVSAETGARTISLKLRPDKVTTDRAEVLQTLSHELTLHLLPWARPKMLDELRGHIHRRDLTAAQHARFRTVLGRISENEGRLAAEVKADMENKDCTSFGGNHSDVALWSIHFQNILMLADQEKSNQGKLLLLAIAVNKARNSMLFTGLPEDVVDRGALAFEDFYRVMVDVLARYRGILAEVVRNREFVIDERAVSNFIGDLKTILGLVEQYRSATATKPEASPSSVRGTGM